MKVNGLARFVLIFILVAVTSTVATLFELWGINVRDGFITVIAVIAMCVSNFIWIMCSLATLTQSPKINEAQIFTALATAILLSLFETAAMIGHDTNLILTGYIAIWLANLASSAFWITAITE